MDSGSDSIWGAWRNQDKSRDRYKSHSYGQIGLRSIYLSLSLASLLITPGGVLASCLKRTTAAASPPAPSHRARGSTWPALDTSAPLPHTSRRPHCGKTHAPPAWSAALKCRLLP